MECLVQPILKLELVKIIRVVSDALNLVLQHRLGSLTSAHLRQKSLDIGLEDDLLLNKEIKLPLLYVGKVNIETLEQVFHPCAVGLNFEKTVEHV